MNHNWWQEQLSVNGFNSTAEKILVTNAKEVSTIIFFYNYTYSNACTCMKVLLGMHGSE